MEASLAVPTATSVRAVPAKLLEVNRKVINNALQRGRGGKVSFTHLIGYAIVRAHRRRRAGDERLASPRCDGKPRARRATSTSTSASPIDVAKADGTRTLLVPVHQATPTRSTSPSSWPPTRSSSARSAPTSSTVDDFAGRHGHAHQPGHDRHRAVRAAPDAGPGRHRRRRRASTTRPSSRAPTATTLADSAISKVITITSHLRPPHHPGRRVAAMFLKRVHELLLGERRLLRRRSSRALGMPVRGRPAGAATSTRRPRRGDARQADARSPR